MFVQFEDSKKNKIVSVFEGPQSEEDFPNQGQVEDDDPRYLAFIEPRVIPAVDPLEKLAAFLAENPDVASKVGL